jgi:hypothetical protein
MAAAMHWTPLPKGAFTGIDWAKPGATRGFDPYLVWAEADRFAGYQMDGPPQWLPLLVQLAPGVSVAQLRCAASPRWLHVAPVYDVVAGLSFCTARVRSEFFRQIRPGGRLHALVQRFELGLPLGDGDDPNRPARTAKAPQLPLLRGKVLGIIDGGLAFAHANFRRPNGQTRIARFWRQDQEGWGPPPDGLGYGHELAGTQIDRAMRRHTHGGLVDETQVYREFRLGLELDKRANHGTHVLDVVAGPRKVRAQVANLPPHFDAPPTWTLADDDASRCDIVAVQLDWDTVVDTSGGSMNVHIMDGLMYVLSRCAADARIAINVSWGTLAGPHDGSSVLESAMDQLVALREGRLQIALPASNGYQDRMHANATLEPGEQISLHWCGQPQDRTENFLELWIQPGARGLRIELTPPGRRSLPPLAWGESGLWTDESGRPLCALIYPQAVATGAHGTCALLAVAPTFAFEATRATAPSGRWQLKLRNAGPGQATFDAYVERDDEIIGVRTGARPSHFEDEWYDTSGNPGSFVDHADNPSAIRRSGTFNSIGTGARTVSVGGTRLAGAPVSVGGTRLAGAHWARYSPRKPDPDGSRLPQRPGVVKVPTTDAASDENAALPGLRAAGSRSGGAVRLVGTSDAAPQVTRKLFNGL